MNRKYMDIIVIVVLILIVGILYFAVKSITTEGTRCATDPYLYIVSNLEKVNRQNITCECRGTYGGGLFFNRNYKRIYHSDSYGSGGVNLNSDDVLSDIIFINNYSMRVYNVSI